jgi:hypothetical protein
VTVTVLVAPGSWRRMRWVTSAGLLVRSPTALGRGWPTAARSGAGRGPTARPCPGARSFERVTRPQGGVQPHRAPPSPPAGGRDLGQPGPHVGLEPGGEEHNGRDAGLLHRAARASPSAAEIAMGFSSSRCLPRFGRADGDRGLHTRRAPRRRPRRHQPEMRRCRRMPWRDSGRPARPRCRSYGPRPLRTRCRLWRQARAHA